MSVSDETQENLRFSPKENFSRYRIVASSF